MVDLGSLMPMLFVVMVMVMVMPLAEGMPSGVMLRLRAAAMVILRANG